MQTLEFSSSLLGCRHTVLFNRYAGILCLPLGRGTTVVEEVSVDIMDVRVPTVMKIAAKVDGTCLWSFILQKDHAFWIVEEYLAQII